MHAFNSLQKKIVLPLTLMAIITLAVTFFLAAHVIVALSAQHAQPVESSSLDFTGAAAALAPAILAAAFGALCTAVAGWLLVRRTVTIPLGELVARIEETAQLGKAEALVPRKSSDEIGRLSAALQRMFVGLQEAQQKLREKETIAAVGRVADSITHEIHEPLVSLKKHVETLRVGADDIDAIGLIAKEMERLELLVDELRYYSNPGALRVEVASLHEIIDDVLETSADKLRGLKLRKAYDANLRSVKADPARLKQAVLNLVLNAIQAMPASGALTIRTRTGSESVEFEVEDTGSGIPADAQEVIFEPFYSTRAGGMGLGLVVSRMIIEEHGGRVDFERTDTGTVFRVHLPAA